MSNYRDEYKNYMESIKLGETSKITGRMEMIECTPARGNREWGFLMPVLGLGAAAVVAFLLVITVPNIRPESGFSPAASDYEDLYPLAFSEARINTGGRFVGTAQEVSLSLPHSTTVSLLPEMEGFTEARARYALRGGELLQVSVRQTATNSEPFFLPPPVEYVFGSDEAGNRVTRPYFAEFHRRTHDVFLRNALIAAPPIDGIISGTTGWTTGFEELRVVPETNRAAVTMWPGERTWFDMSFYGVAFGETPPTAYVHGVPVAAWLYNISGSLYQFGADFFLNGNTYAVRFNDIQPLDTAKLHLTRLVNEVIAAGGMNLSQVASEKTFEFRNEIMTHQDALQDPRFGEFVPTEAFFPPPIIYGARSGNLSQIDNISISARRVLTQYTNDLSINWSGPDFYLHWWIEDADMDAGTIYFGSMPPFELADLTLEDILESTRTAAEMFSNVPDEYLLDPTYTWTHFRVTHENTRITIRGFNTPPQLIWDIIQGLSVPV
jgi:hypothetical protein